MPLNRGISGPHSQVLCGVQCVYFLILEIEYPLFAPKKNSTFSVCINKKYRRFEILLFQNLALRRSLSKYLNFHIPTVHLDIIKVLFIHQLMH